MDDLGYLKDKTISSEEGVIPKYLILKWQDIVNLLAKLISVPVVLIKKSDLSYIEILCANESQDNPFKIGERTHLSGLYCEKVIQQGEKLLIPNAIEDKDWNKNLESNKNMCSYLGYPLFFPDGNIFGTICVLDTKKNTYSINFEHLIKYFKELIEAHLLQIDFSNKFGETEQNYRNIVEQSLMGILIFQDNEIKYINQKMADLLEYSKDEIVNLEPNEMFKIIHPEFIEYAKERLMKKDFDLMISTGQNIMEMVKKSGETYWGQNFAKSIIYKGKPAILLLQIDISKRKKIEEEVDLHKQRLESLLKLSQMHNTSEKELIKFALEESVKLTKSYVGYLHFFNEDQKSIDLYIWSNNVMEQCYTEENSHYSLDKAGIWADCVRYRKPIIHNDYQNNPNKKGYPKGHFPVKRHMSIPVFEGNHIVVIIGVGNKVLPYDDTDIRQLTLYMDNMWRILNQKRSEMQYQVLFNAAPNGILITTTNAQILDCNPFFESLIGYKKEDIIGKTIFELPIYEKESFNFIIDLYNNNLIENHPEVIEYPIIHKNGNKIWIDIQISKIKKGEKMIYQSIIRDISARKKIEKILIDSENKYRKAYEQANFYKDLFSHDISNFIQVI
ncbi:MAG: PAS domain S-box protein, partial [Candidatus Lokiarchaeota archaeon]|nr:PAS domain S-box protein [Candidatus Lokiarchaeota archaeon]